MLLAIVTKASENSSTFHFFNFSIFSLFIISEADVVAGRGVGVPGDVEPAGAGEELVGGGVRLQVVHEAVELCRVAGTDVGCLQTCLEKLQTVYPFGKSQYTLTY